jgi:hypothetical protein
VSAPPPVPGRSRRARRTRILLLAAGGVVVVAAAAALLLRPRPAPYTPGTDQAHSEEITRRLARDLPADLPAVAFVDAAAEAGVRFRHFHGRRSTQLPEDMGSGAAWGDYDGDGDPDLYLVNVDGPLNATPEEAGRSPARSALFRNDGGRFTDVTDAAGAGVRGCGMGAAWGDADGDGDLDLVVTRFGASVLLRNRGDGTFEDISGVSGIGGPRGFWSGAAWGDYDRDGDVDLHVAGYVQYRYDPDLARRTSLQYRAMVPYTLNPSSYSPERNLLFRNDGGRFREIGREAGVDNRAGRSLSASWSDFDGDGWPDLYVANDISDNVFYRNLGGGRFADISHAAWVADYRGAMGIGVGDWDNDADLDMFITHWIAQENALYDNVTGGMAPKGDPRFLDIADQVGLGQSTLDFVGWGADFLDYDNDGRLDLFAVNGSTFQRDDDPSLLVPMRNQLFWNAGRERGFFDAGTAAGAALGVENVGRGAAFADYDDDGDLDIVVVVNGGEARLLRNDGGDAGAWARLVLRGRANRFAVGAVVRLTAGGVTQMREIGSGPSYLSQSPPGEAHFGIGKAETIDRVEIVWPSGSRQTFSGLPVRATIRFDEGRAPVLER